MTVKSCEKLEKSMVALTIEVDAAAFEAAVEKAYQKMRRKISIPGFRPGKAPRKMIERMYGAEVFFEEAINIAFPEAYEAAVEQEKLQVIGYPAVEMVGEVTKDGFTFKATAPVYPEVTLGEYKGLKAEKPEVKVTAADVEERLKQLADRNTRLVSVEREAKSGDTAVIDFEGFKDGVPFEGGKGTNHSLELGSGSFVPGFEDQVIGMKAGEEKDIDITFPENYTKDLAGKQVVFHVKVNEVKEKQTPALDDEFAKDVSEFETLKELKDDTKAKITAEREQSAKIAFENALLEKVAGDIKADIPEVMIEEQCRRFLDEFKQRLQAQGIPYDQYCKMTGMDEAKFMEDGREPAVRQVKMDLAIAAIIKAENLDVTDEEIEEKYKSMAEQYGMELDMLKKYLDAPTVRNQLLNEKAIAVVVDSAKVEKPAKAEKTEGEEEKKPAKKTAKKAAEGEEEKKPAAKKTTKKAAEGEEAKKPAKKPEKKAAEKAK